MGMTIDEARTALGKERKYALHENKQAFDIAIETMRKYQQLQADYENRLKADMIAMLEDLDLRLEEMENPFSTRVSGCSKDGWEHGVKNSRFLINEKINKLKGE